jgi:hypothetical protein
VALQGTLRDFGLPDIFQLIGIQRKTGLLVLERDSDRVTLKFLDGQIVGADTLSESLEDRLGEVLVRTERISAAQLEAALQLQKKTLRKLGLILVEQGLIGEEELVDALRLQSSQIVYRLFRWRNGSYRFTPAEHVDYDTAHFTPLSADTVLMEGARMMDEWPIIERRIRSDRVILRLTAEGAARAAACVDPEAIDRPPVEADAPGGRPLSDEERSVLVLVDGRRPIREIGDLVALGEFDTSRVLSDLVSRGLIEEVPAEKVKPARGRLLIARLLRSASVFAVLALAAGGLWLMPAAPWSPWRILAASPATERLRSYVTSARLERLERAIQLFYLDAGTVPDSLEALAGGGYVREADLIDPWGRSYGFELSAGGYRLQGYDAAGQPAVDFAVSRSFGPLQRMLLAGGDPP